MCGYILAINLQNFTEVLLDLSENIAKSFRGATFFDSHCTCKNYSLSQRRRQSDIVQHVNCKRDQYFTYWQTLVHHRPTIDHSYDDFCESRAYQTRTLRNKRSSGLVMCTKPKRTWYCIIAGLPPTPANVSLHDFALLCTSRRHVLGLQQAARLRWST